MKKGRIVAGVVALLVVAAVALAVLGRSRAAVPEVETAEVERGELAVVVSASGEVETDQKAEVYPPTAGTLEAVYVTDGQEVEAGQELALMDTEALELEVAAAEAAYAAARAALDAVDEQVPSHADLDAAAASTDAAWLSYTVARDPYDALKETYDAAPEAVQASMEASLTAAQLARDQAYAAFLAAKAQEESLVRARDVSGQRASAQAQADQAAVSLAAAQDHLARATLTTPIDGVVVFNAVGVPGVDGSAPMPAAGVGVSSASAPFTIVQLGVLAFVADVDEVDVDLVDVEMSATVVLDAFPGREFETKVNRVGNVARLTQTGATAFAAWLGLAGTGSDLKVGMQGSAEIAVETITDAVTVPFEALFGDTGDEFVFVIEDGVAHERRVTTGASTDLSIQVTEGLAAGETVALTGTEELEDGMKVRPVEPRDDGPDGFGPMGMGG